MKQIHLESGTQEYTLNDSCVIRFNPTDLFFVEQLYNAMDALGQMDEKRAEIAGSDSDTRSKFDAWRHLDAQARQIINDLFGVDVCGACWGNVSPMAFSGGFPLWANLLCALIDEIDETVKAEHAASMPRVNKYLKKYHR